MDPRQIRSEKLPKPKIWEAAEHFRQTYIGDHDVPVNIEIVAERIGILIVPAPNLNSHLGMDGFLSKDLKFLYIDEDLYSDEDNRYEPRIRFTIAHELGHYALHRGVLDSFEFESEGDWLKFRLNLPPETTGWFEYQANEFSGRLLVPLDALIQNTREARSSIMKTLSWNSNPISNEQLASMVAPIICGIFTVSSEVIEKRLKNDLAFVHLGI